LGWSIGAIERMVRYGRHRSNSLSPASAGCFGSPETWFGEVQSSTIITAPAATMGGRKAIIPEYYRP
jgi:hypothetical protein